MKRPLHIFLLSAAVMLGFPWLAVTLVKGDAGMAVCFLLFFAVDPAYSFWVGWQSGKCIQRLWYPPLLTAALFLFGCWLTFDMGEPGFLLYSGIYLLLGYAAMIGSLLFRKWKT